MKYLGSKKDLIPAILQYAPEASSVLDAFSGTSRVGQAFKKKGCVVVSNDHNEYARTIAGCYIVANKGIEHEVQPVLDELNALRDPSPSVSIA